MIYIKCTKDYKEAFDGNSNIPNFLKKMIFKAKSLFGNFFVKKIPNGELIVLPNKKLACRKKLIKFLNVYSVKTICISKELEELDFFKDTDFNILNGKWLYKYLILNYVKYIANEKCKNIQELEISFLVNKPSDVDLENISETSKLCRCVNIVTYSDKRFKTLADKLYKENGIILNITKNYKKGLTKSSIIINIDFQEEEMSKFVIPRKAVIINIGKNIKINYKGFDGLNILDYNTSFPEKYLSQELNLNSFRKEILYESYLYKNTSPKNILKEIRDDKIYIESLIGQKGVIRKTEFSN